MRNLHLTFDCMYSTVVKSKVKILQNFVAFSEYMNFNKFEETFHRVISVRYILEKLSRGQLGGHLVGHLVSTITFQYY